LPRIIKSLKSFNISCPPLVSLSGERFDVGVG
jgi:hypothetical protein